MKALFDFDFRKFITPSIIKIVYILIMVLLVIAYLVFVIASFRTNGALGFTVLILVGPLFVLIYLVLARAGLESLIAQIRTAENTAELVRLAGGTPPSERGAPEGIALSRGSCSADGRRWHDERDPVSCPVREEPRSRRDRGHLVRPPGGTAVARAN